MTPPPRQASSRPLALCHSGNIGGATLDATPCSGPGSGSDLIEESHPLTRHITLLPSESTSEVLFSPPDMGLTSRTLLPEGDSSADPSGGAQPSMQIAERGASVDEVLHQERHPRSREAAGTSADAVSRPLLPGSPRVAVALKGDREEAGITDADNDSSLPPAAGVVALAGLLDLPNEVLLQILRYLDVCDLLCTSRTSQRLRSLSLSPILHAYRLQHTRTILAPMLWSPFRPSLADLMRRSIFLTRTTVVSRKLARSLVCIRLARRLAARPSVEALVARSVLPPECLPTEKKTAVAPALVAKKRAVERERVKDGLRRWVERVWRREVGERSEGVRRWEERAGVGRVWRLRRFWESVGRMEEGAPHQDR